MIRDGTLAFNKSKSRLVRRKCPRWFVAKVVSSPSTVWIRLGRKIPALLMRTWSFLYLLLKSCASSRTESWGRQVRRNRVDVVITALAFYLDERRLSFVF